MSSITNRLFTALAACLLVSAASVGPAFTQALLRVAAVVNDDVISDHDLDARIRMVLISSGIPVRDETRKRMENTVLDALIREKLQLQEARRLNIKISRKQLAKALERLEQRNRLQRGKLLASLRRQGIPPSTVIAQVNATLAWNQVVRRRIRPFVRVSEEEVDGELERIKENRAKPHFRIAEIYLPVNTPDEDEDARRTAQKLLDQIRRGARFNALARQFSQAPTASRGGDVGELQRGQLDKAIEATLDSLKIGQVTGPIRTASGYYIIQLTDRRIVRGGKVIDPRVTFAQVQLGYGGKPTVASVNRQRALARRLGQAAKSCDEFVVLGRKRSGGSSQVIKNVKVNSLTPLMRKMLSRTKINQATKSIATPQGVQIFMLCSRSNATDLPNRQQVLNQIFRRELNIRTQQYLRDLRRGANIEIRG